MNFDDIVDEGRIAGQNSMWERLADIEVISRECSPRTHQKFAIDSIFHFLKIHQSALNSIREFYFDLSTWTNIAWRHLARNDVDKLDRDARWIQILERLQGAAIGVAMILNVDSFSFTLTIKSKTYIKIFGKDLCVSFHCERDSAEEFIETWTYPTRKPDVSNLVFKELPSVDGIIVSRDGALREMVAAVGFEVMSSRDDIVGVVNTLRNSLRIISHDTENLGIVKQFVGLVVPIENPNYEEHKSLSIESTPGAIYIGKNCKLEIFAEALVHEADHQRLYEIQRSKPLTKEASTSRFCSPWRMDPRPASGLIFGASAFFRVSRFWDRLLKSDQCSFDERKAGYRALFTASQSLDALETLISSRDLTAFGRFFCENLKGEAERHYDSFRSSSQFDVWSDEAAQKLFEHKREWVLENEGPRTATN